MSTAILTGPSQFAPSSVRGDGERRRSMARVTQASASAGGDETVLGVVRYGGADAAGIAAWNGLAIPLTVLAGSGAVVWRGAQPTRAGTLGAVRYRSDGDWLVGTYEDAGAEAGRIEQATVTAYRALFQAARAAGCPHVYRIWNYVPEINREIGGLEVYKSFCIGRQRVFDDAPLPPGGAVPAACAIGTAIPGLRLYFFAGRHPAEQLSNPRQIEAWDYPPAYGPRSPVFSRAAVVGSGASCQLHLSGTASIVGHATRHHGDVDAQVVETLNNLQALLQQTGVRLRDLGSDSLFTVYLRHAADLGAVRDRFAAVVSPEVGVLYLRGDICRRSLLIEIEGIIPVPHRAAAPAP